MIVEVVGLKHFLIVLTLAFLVVPFGTNAQDDATSKAPPVQRFSDWYYRCPERPAGEGVSKRYCEVVQVAQSKDGKRLLTLGITRAAKPIDGKPWIVTLITPLNVYLPAKLDLQIDRGRRQSYAYRNCNEGGCWVVISASDALVNRLKRGNQATVRFQTVRQKNINLRISLSGVTKALQALTSGASPVQE